jgi:hypothetical protein
MPWSNGTITVYHGTDNLSANAIRASGLDPNRFNSKTDFGKGFYVTTSLHQAQQWANQRCRPTAHLNPEVLEYQLLRDVIESLTHLAFIMDTIDYHEFVEYCRPGRANHGPHPRSIPYDVVYGPVRLWPQRIVLANCDQILFTDPTKLRDSGRRGRDFSRPVGTVRPPAPNRFFQEVLMPQIDAKDLDHSPDMKQYFESVKNILVEQYRQDRHTANVLVDRYFSLDVDPLERSLVMHRPPDEVARDLVQGNR